MNKYYLLPNNLVFWESNCPIIRVDVNNYHDHINLINKTIKIFKKEVKWNNMYSTTEAFNRFKEGGVLYLLLDKNVLFGYCWVKEYLDGYIIFNVFMRRRNVKNKWRGRELISKIIKDYYLNKKIYCFIDEWNDKSIRLFESVGFKRKQYG